MIGQTRFVRRTFVVCAYAMLLCLVVFHGTTGSPFAFRDLGFVFLLFLVMVSHRRIADRIRRKLRPLVPNPDERDVAVRDHACYIALNIVAWYTLFLCLVSGAVVRFPSPYMFSAALMNYALFPLLIIAFTLPSAVVLWLEPDVVREKDS